MYSIFFSTAFFLPLSRSAIYYQITEIGNSTVINISSPAQSIPQGLIALIFDLSVKPWMGSKQMNLL